MTSTSKIGGPMTVIATRSRRRVWIPRAASALLVAGSCVTSLAFLPSTAQAAQRAPVGASSARVGRGPIAHSAVANYCAKIPASKISPIVGATVKLFEAVVNKTSLECIYFDTSVSAKVREVVLTMQPGMNPVIASLSQAEATLKARSPKTVRIIFTAQPSVGKTAFTWTYSKPLNGGQLVGIGYNKGSTGYGAAIGGAAKTFGSAASYVTALKKLLALTIAA